MVDGRYEQECRTEFDEKCETKYEEKCETKYETVNEQVSYLDFHVYPDKQGNIVQQCATRRWTLSTDCISSVLTRIGYQEQSQVS